MSRRILLAVLLILVIANSSYGQDKFAEFGIEDIDIEQFGIEYCKWLSILARDMMIARQQGRPMSETLPASFERLREFPLEMIGALDIEGVSERLEQMPEEELQVNSDRIVQSMKPFVTEMVNYAYDVPAYSMQSLQQNAINDYENQFFSMCYEGFQEGVSDLDEEEGQ